MIYAVGDIHGRLDLLKKLYELIIKDSETHKEPHTIIFIGDYIDRGPESCQVIKFLLSKPFKGFKHIMLKGNHEQMMIDEMGAYNNSGYFNKNSMWWLQGGIYTLNSYKWGLKDPVITKHLKWMEKLKVIHKQQGIIFVHAGINPETPEEEWTENEMLWIRDKFLTYTEDFGYLVVHGHCITPDYDIWFDRLNITNRINLDTGAYKSNVLTAIAINKENKFKFIEACYK